VFESDAAEHWLRLLEAFDQPHRSGLVCSAAATMFFGMTADDLAAGDEKLTEQVTETIRRWSDQARERGIAAVFEAAQVAGMGERVLALRGGERAMTDLAHIAQLLHDVAHRERFSLPALRDWLRRQRDERNGPPERNRRLDSDAKAVQVMTVWGAKGLQFPIVYLPFGFNRHVWIDDIPLYHDEADVRCLHIGGKDSPDRGEVEELSKAEEARNDIRLTYVALTRAKSQVVAWWAPSWDEPTGGLSRLLRGRRIGDPKVPDRCSPSTVSDQVAVERFRDWQDAGGPMVEQAVIGPAFAAERPELPIDLDVRHFHRLIDTQWRRTSYTALIKSTEQAGVGSEPEVTARDDEVDTAPVTAPTSVGADIASPMTELPAGAAFGSLVHAVLENADPLAADLAAELEIHVREQMAWWAVDVEPSPLAEALVPMHDTPLGPLADGLTLRQIGLSDRLRELDFEIPLAGGDLRALEREAASC
jgi:exodeoxyribonuclease V beta subunit